jgi:hypothetical protein
MYYDLEKRLTPSDQQVVGELSADKQLEGLDLVVQIAFKKDFLRDIETYRSNTNYEYWEMRAQAEQRDDMVDARRLTFQANQFIDSAQVKEAMESYEKAWEKWSQVFSRYPVMATEEVGDDVMKSLKRYARLADLEIDESFILNEWLVFRRAKEDPSLGLDFNQFSAVMDNRARAILAAERNGEENPAIPKLPFPFNGLPSADSAAPSATLSPSPTTQQPDTTIAPSTVPATVEPAPTVPAEPAKETEKKEETLTRPPTLENPDSQD